MHLVKLGPLPRVFRTERNASFSSIQSPDEPLPQVFKLKYQDLFGIRKKTTGKNTGLLAKFV